LDFFFFGHCRHSMICSRGVVKNNDHKNNLVATILAAGIAG
jgi:hypothetical protein